MIEQNPNITIHEDARHVNLPKWPAMVVQGKDVTIEQAAEILIKTDSNLPNFEYASNSESLNNQLSNLFGISDRDVKFEDFNNYWNSLQNLRERLGHLSLSYLYNSQIASCYIGGPHGWCNWRGNIFTNSYNIGKWPSVEEVANDWSMIATAFPYLDLTCQLYDREQCESGGHPVVEFRVSGGYVEVSKPTKTLAGPVDNVSISSIFGDPRLRESGITVNDLKEKLEMVYGEIPQFKHIKDNTDDD